MSAGLVHTPTAFTHSALLAVRGNDADAQLSMVIAGLLGLAVVILVVTIIFWRVTRPTPTRSGQTTGPSER